MNLCAAFQVFNSWVEGNGEAAVSAFGPGSEIKASNTDLGMSQIPLFPFDHVLFFVGGNSCR